MFGLDHRVAHVWTLRFWIELVGFNCVVIVVSCLLLRVCPRARAAAHLIVTHCRVFDPASLPLDGVLPALPPPARRVIVGPGGGKPQEGHPTPTRDQRQRGGKPQKERIQGRHRVGLLQPLVQGMQRQKTDTVLDWHSPCVPLA